MDEAKILARLADALSEQELLELVLSKAIQLASVIDARRHTPPDERSDGEYTVLVAPKVARMALLLDVLQLKCGNVEQEELEYLKTMQEFLDDQAKEKE